ncbi:Putative bifunctional phosphatase/peptidyl-prolyl cis-trans isomerase [Planctomycetes bacterium Pla163]|uniref:peptidylprolyl isomerase n=1 Tax=Rohdeia mirabilis TaxID=2528008 RepID=A0A518CYD5_9BACT|nr:Putative bifunctional phosphatase/peptidyl-prolyl cis-trans isomerase [Planctomycetes bacterium Pla163]
MSFNALALITAAAAASVALLGTSIPATATAPVAFELEAPKVSFEAPGLFIAGQPYEVTIDVEAGKNGSPLAGWIISPAAFLVDGVPLGERTNEAMLQLPPGAKLSVTFDLGQFIEAERGFELAFAKNLSNSAPISVAALAPVAAGGQSFMERDVDTLGDYVVVMETTAGPLVLEFWPDRAPNHVRNFLDLSYTGFYDGIIFHRVMKGFMIQGGDPQGTGTGGGPRTLDAEFSDADHVRGVLSAARLGHDVNSATSQFFIMHAHTPSLNGQYSAYGKLVMGYDTLDAIATTQTSRGDKPVVDQVIESARVYRRMPAAEKKGGE